MIGITIFAISVLVVLATSLIKNVDMSTKVKTAIATVLSIIGGVVADLSSKGFDVSQYAGLDMMATALAILGTSNLVYTFIMKGTKLDAALENADVPLVPKPEIKAEYEATEEVSEPVGKEGL